MPLDFTSALYLGLRHASNSLPAWSQLTLGKPAALSEWRSSRSVAQHIASLQGCESGVLGASTLHLFWDLGGMLAAEGAAFYADAGIYPVARWGLERASARGATVKTFTHHDPLSLAYQMRRDSNRAAKPYIVTDGFCPTCGRPAPLPQYLEIARRFSGSLIVDDTQALGVLGHSPSRYDPYGLGGGGSMRYCDVHGDELLVVSSLAKGFGTPAAVLSGARATVERFTAQSETRVHCSPPSTAVIAAARQALLINQKEGDAKRRNLAALVRRFRKGLATLGLSATKGFFPVQTLMPFPGSDPMRLHRQLRQAGVRTVLLDGRNNQSARICFLFTSCHHQSEVDHALNLIKQFAKLAPVGTPGCKTS